MKGKGIHKDTVIGDIRGGDFSLRCEWRNSCNAP
jgi:hypothetical protein